MRRIMGRKQPVTLNGKCYKCNTKTNWGNGCPNCWHIDRTMCKDN